MRLLSLAPPFCGSLHAGGGRAGGREAGKEGWREGDAGGAGGEGHTCRRGRRGRTTSVRGGGGECAAGTQPRGSFPRPPAAAAGQMRWQLEATPHNPEVTPRTPCPDTGKRRPRWGRCARSWTDSPPTSCVRSWRQRPSSQMCLQVAAAAPEGAGGATPGAGTAERAGSSSGRGAENQGRFPRVSSPAGTCLETAGIAAKKMRLRFPTHRRFAALGWQQVWQPQHKPCPC